MLKNGTPLSARSHQLQLGIPVLLAQEFNRATHCNYGPYQEERCHSVVIGGQQ
jgi:hypothetical protein